MAMRRRFMNDTGIDINKYLTFAARENNTSVSLTNYDSLDNCGFSDIRYSINGGRLIKGDVNKIIINNGETLSVKATYHPASSTKYKMINISKPVDVIGTISSIENTNGYSYIFSGASIVDASLLSLPVTTLADWCYSHMFHGCAILTTAPELPATTLASSCYSHMFYGCTSLITAPELPATILTNSCYWNMFTGCSKLNYVKMLATNISASNCLYNWVSGVASSGTFAKNPAMNGLPTGTSGIPSGWTVVNVLDFTVDGVVYHFEDGMTWADWCDSSYNTGGFKFYEADSLCAVYTSDYKKYFKTQVSDTTLVEAGAYETKEVDWPMPMG